MLPAQQAVAAPRDVHGTHYVVLLALSFAVLSPWAVVADDVVWQLWVGAQINNGFKFYSDIPELNPPLWFWLGAIAVKVGEWLHFAPVTAYFLIVSAICLVALALFWRFTSHLEHRQRLIWLFSWTLALFGLGWLNFGQREHIFVATMIGYIALIAGRCGGRQVPVPLALATGCFAALGICFKHYFLIVPLLLEAWLLLSLGRGWRPWRPEVIACALSGLAYVAAVAWITPDYLSQIVPMAMLAYGSYDQPLLTCVRSVMPTLAAMLIIHRHCRMDGDLKGPLLIAIAGFAISGIVQQKLLVYHMLPGNTAIAATMLASIGILTFDSRARIRNAAGTLLVLGLTLTATQIEYIRTSLGNAGTYWNDPSLPFPFEKGKPVALLAASRSDFTNYTLRGGAKLGHRYMTLWTLPAIANADAATLSAALKALGDKLRQDVVDDLVCDPPASILIATHTSDMRVIQKPFDYVAFFSADARFADLFAGYRYVDTRHALRFYERTRDISAAEHCHPFPNVSLFAR